MIALPALGAGLVAGILAAAGWPGASGRSVVVGVVAGVLVGLVLLASGRRRAALAVVAFCVAAGFGVIRADATRLAEGPDSVGGAIGAGELAVEATVMDDARPREDRLQLVLDQVVVASGDRTAALRGRLLAWVPRTLDLGPGDRIRLRAAFEEPPVLDAFDYRAYLARQGIGAIARSFEVEVIGHGAFGPAALLAGTRAALQAGLDDLVPEPEAALGVGILLGVRTGIDPALADAFAAAGLTHVVAISGWNIAIVTALTVSVLRPLRRRPGGRWTEAGATLLVVVGYVILVGGSASVVRAALMASALLVARLGGSRGHAGGALTLAAVAMLAVAPPLLWDVGFQLSALATAGLLAFAGSIDARLRFLPPLVREPVALTIAAQIATLPIVLGSFERLSLVAPLANVAVVPLIPLVMATSAMAAPIGAILHPLPSAPGVDQAAWLTGGMAWLPLRALAAIGTAAGSLPFASVPVAPPGWLPFAWYPAVAAFALRRPAVEEPVTTAIGLVGIPSGTAEDAQRGGTDARRRPPAWSIGVAAVALLGALTLASGPDGRLHLVALDIGQGDAILVVAPSGRTALIDGGPDPERTLRELGRALPFHQRRIDLVVLTHPHQDHVAGLVDVLRRFRVGMILDGERAFPNPTYARFRTDALREPAAQVVTARVGMSIALDPTTRLRVLFPSDTDADAPLPDDDINNASVVLLLTGPGATALLTGDAEAPVERLLIDRGLVPDVTVLKVGHHGSTSSSSAIFLDAARPELALISCGLGNDYGHPAPSTLDALAARGVTTLRTDVDGTSEVTSDGRMIEARAGGRLVARLPAEPAPLDAASAATIGTWQSPIPPPPRRFSPGTSCPTASSRTRVGCRASRRRARRCWRPPGCRWMRTSSRSPPCCMTSTSWRRGAPARRTASSARAG